MKFFAEEIIFKRLHLIINLLNYLLSDRDQRRRYHTIREKAETDQSIMSIIIDGMDQNATNLPHCKRVQKSDCNKWHLRTHLTGMCVCSCVS